MSIFVVCSKVCSGRFTFIGLYGLLLCEFINEKSTSSLGSTKSEKATDLWSVVFIHIGE